MSRVLQVYREYAPTHFQTLPEDLSAEEVEGLMALHRDRLGAEREERRMHFGAFALTGILLFILVPPLVASGGRSVPLVILALLLVALVIPYAFVYYRYENRVRSMTEGLFRLRERRLSLMDPVDERSRQ